MYFFDFIIFVGVARDQSYYLTVKLFIIYLEITESASNIVSCLCFLTSMKYECQKIMSDNLKEFSFYLFILCSADSIFCKTSLFHGLLHQNITEYTGYRR